MRCGKTRTTSRKILSPRNVLRLTIVSTNRTWYELRALLARPPGLAHAEERAAVFAAALVQSEELFRASRAASYASKPLPLFYALSQAGRAIAAARDASSSWEITAHGLSVIGAEDPSATTVKPAGRRDGSDAFSAVSRAIASPAVNSAVSVAEIWASIPELERLVGMRGDALAVVPAAPVDADQPDVLSSLVAPARATLLLPGASSVAEVEDLLSRYARTEGYVHLVPPAIARAGAFLTLDWPALPGGDSGLGTRQFRALAEIMVGDPGSWYLQPLIGTPGVAPKPLALWWMLLLALSSLARYHPATWATGLDLRASVQAVELQEALDIAETRVPELILEELSQT